MLDYNGKRILVLGLGDTGISAVRWLLAHGAEVLVADSRPNPPALPGFKEEFPSLTVICGPFTPELFEGVDEIVASPGIPVSSLPTRRQVIGDIELFARAMRQMPTKIIAITGSNGKTTVTSMVGEMCKAAGLKTVVAGNIGLPVLSALGEVEQALAGGAVAPQVYVLELSSFQLETTHSLNANAATVLNVSEDHLDRYDDITAYATSKARIFLGDGVQVLNREDAWCYGMDQFGRLVHYFSLEAPVHEADFGLVDCDGRLSMRQGSCHLLWADELQVAGLHNVANALAALALCRATGIPLEPAVECLKHFKGLPHRVELVRELKGVSFYDDSKGTNVGATVAALNGLSQPVLLIAGGDGKGQDFSPLKAAIERICKAVVLIGRDAPAIQHVLRDSSVEVINAVDMETAVHACWQRAVAGDLILLSPACASLDMYRNYAHRAQMFIDAAQHIADREERV